MKTFYLLAVLSCLSSFVFSAQTETQTGYFIDSPVSGLYYETSSHLSGTTNKGAFEYNPGDIISFFIGNDSSGYLLTTLSAQQVITPTLSSTKPSRSINMTRLLLSLDSTPENREEIVLASKILSDVEFQKQLKSIDLSYLDSIELSLGLELVSTKEATEHLNQSQQYIKKNFTSDEIIFSPKNIKMSNIIIMKKDWAGRACMYDLAHANNPKYHGPIGSTDYKVTDDELIQYPSIGDYFKGCNLVPGQLTSETIREPIENTEGWSGLIGCAAKGCTRNDLSGFAIEDYDDEGDWKYRTVALDFDPTTQLLMEKIQGLGKNEHIRHSNKREMIWFTYPASGKGDAIPYQGFWQHTIYKQTDMVQQCLYINNKTVLQAEMSGEHCSTDGANYTQDVTHQYGDMWWLGNKKSTASLAQLNTQVRWYDSVPNQHFTTWEYLPAGANWDEGILYRFRQAISLNGDGSHEITTLSVSEFNKVGSNI